MWHLAYGLDLVNHKGLNIYDHELLNRYMRSVRFTGCGGQISFSRNSNDISFKWLDVSQFRRVNDTDTLELDYIGAMQSFSAKPHRFKPFQWEGGSHVPPKDTRTEDWECQFPDSEITASRRGETVAFSVGAGFLVFSSVLLFGLWKVFW
jgi:hypothetical protein